MAEDAQAQPKLHLSATEFGARSEFVEALRRRVKADPDSAGPFVAATYEHYRVQSMSELAAALRDNGQTFEAYLADLDHFVSANKHAFMRKR